MKFVSAILVEIEGRKLGLNWLTGKSREHKKKKNAGESERMKTRNEAKKKVLKSTKLGPEKKIATVRKK